MRVVTSILACLGAVSIATGAEPVLKDAPKPPEGFPRFKVQEIDSGLKIGYAVIAVDIDGDKKPDIVVVDQHQVVWYQNPTWKKRIILDGKTAPDNVCITAVDIDGDKLPELVLGAAWKPFDTRTPGTLQWLKRGKTLDDEWTMHKIPCAEPTVHRVRTCYLDSSKKPSIVLAPLMGADSTGAKNWQDGRPVRIISYAIPAKDPEKPENWKAEVISEELRVVHNFLGDVQLSTDKPGLLLASYDGLHFLSKVQSKEKLVREWKAIRVGEGDQSNLKSNRGSSEVAAGYFDQRNDAGGANVEGSNTFLSLAATVEPWHGNKIVVYYTDNELDKMWKREVLDDHLRWGHAVKFAHLGARTEKSDYSYPDLIAGIRDNPTKDDKFTEKRGIRIYRYDSKAKKWNRYILEDGGVAVEDLITCDLNNDGKPDIIAVGRATGNCRIYWNQGK